jgi:hypothetical protein
MIPVELTHYLVILVDVTGGPFQPYLSGLPDSVCTHQMSGLPDSVCTHQVSGLPDSVCTHQVSGISVRST